MEPLLYNIIHVPLQVYCNLCVSVALQDINKAYTFISQSANSGSVDGHVLLGELLLSKETSRVCPSLSLLHHKQ